MLSAVAPMVERANILVFLCAAQFIIAGGLIIVAKINPTPQNGKLAGLELPAGCQSEEPCCLRHPDCGVQTSAPALHASALQRTNLLSGIFPPSRQALLIASSALSFSGPAVVRPARASISMASIEDLPGAGPETGGKVWDPLSLADMCPYGSEQFEWMRTAETKHGRVCMAASVGYLISEAGITFPGYLST